MKEKDFNSILKSIQNGVDIHEPPKGHEDRFLARLNEASGNSNSSKIIPLIWKPLLAIAAALVIFLGVYSGSNNFAQHDNDLASVSPEFAETQDFYVTTIQLELQKLNAERTPLTENIIHHAMRQLTKLEKDYDSLKKDLEESSNDKRVIYAMISNFQNRIDLLTEVLDQIEDLKQLKTTTNETKNTL